MMKRFEGRNIVITGAARGQGAEEARQLVAEGARVFITDVLEEEGKALAAELGAAASFIKHDVSSEADWQVVCKQVQAVGSLHGLVNNAGIYLPQALTETETALFERHFRINQLGTFLGMKSAAAIAAPEGASIVNISSIAGLRGSHGVSYTGTKWAVRGMTKTAAVELAAQNIRVNSVHPGIIHTKMLESWSEERMEKRVGMVPLRRGGTSQDIASLVLFLLSDESSYVTGAEFVADGGLTAG
ncbi:MAG: SDR family NAD(P)-dependent oxidoreductase [Flavobacteriaceae bacterium]